MPIVTTGRADPGPDVVRRLKAAGIKVVSVIPTVEHARRMEAEGVDAVVASGTEAGGHVGTVATLPLVPQVVDAVKIPVLAAGGIGDARGFLAAFALGAVGVQMGTRFMATVDAGRAHLLAMHETDTIVTRVLTGATVRCVRTPEIVAYEDALAAHAPEAQLTELKRMVRGARSGDDKSGTRTSAAGQIGGMRQPDQYHFGGHQRIGMQLGLADALEQRGICRDSKDTVDNKLDADAEQDEGHQPQHHQRAE